MIGTGIDQDVQSRMDANRDNPQQLMQNYQQNGELLDLLALQKLKSEKEAAARDLQMQMQNNPQTIAEQREKEVLDLTKQEMQPQRPQQPQGQPQPQQGAPQQGISSVAPPAQGFAEGGIVSGFQDGGYVPGAGPTRDNLKYALAQGATKEELLSIYDQNQDVRAMIERMSSTSPLPTDSTVQAETEAEDRSLAYRFGENVNERFGNVLDSINPFEPAATVAGLLKQPVGDFLEGAGFSSKDDPEANPEPKKEVVADALELIEPQGTRIDPDKPVPPEKSALEKALDRGLAVDPEQARIDAQQNAQSAFGMSDKEKARMSSLLAEQDAAYRRETDPETQRKQKLQEFLRGMGGRSNFGSVMGGGSAASANERERQQKSAKEGLAALIQGQGDFSEAKRDSGIAVYGAGADGRDTAQTALNNAITQATNRSLADSKLQIALIAARAESSGNPISASDIKDVSDIQDTLAAAYESWPEWEEIKRLSMGNDDDKQQSQDLYAATYEKRVTNHPTMLRAYQAIGISQNPDGEWSAVFSGDN